ncbi:MAG TPA: hypothetical protein ENI27_07995 [bacterium]|nr:hypothetical protein [bacterium]
MTPNSEYQKPFSEAGRLNAEIITKKHYCPTGNQSGTICLCVYCEDERDERKRIVNRLMGMKFYEDV